MSCHVMSFYLRDDHPVYARRSWVEEGVELQVHHLEGGGPLQQLQSALQHRHTDTYLQTLQHLLLRLLVTAHHPAEY